MSSALDEIGLHGRAAAQRPVQAASRSPGSDEFRNTDAGPRHQHRVDHIGPGVHLQIDLEARQIVSADPWMEQRAQACGGARQFGGARGESTLPGHWLIETLAGAATPTSAASTTAPASPNAAPATSRPAGSSRSVCTLLIRSLTPPP
jgi:hypothetical protein